MRMATHIAIIGAGPSALYALQALLRSGGPLEVTIYEAGATAGVGVPYDPARTDPSMLANIASVEIPPLGPSLEAWLKSLPDAELTRLRVERASITDRTFFPRVTLGAYFAARLAAMTADAPARGSRVRVLTRRTVVDVVPLEKGGARVLARGPTGAIKAQEHDAVILATGHRAPAGRTKERDEPPMREAYAATAAGDLSGAVGVLGASLSAIDVAVATAARHGAFRRGADGALAFEPRPDAPPFHVTLMSRRGVLPEADFYCVIPYLPLRLFTPEAMKALIESGSSGLLDRAFALFRRELAEADPDYARRVDLERLDADAFPKTYFAARETADPFDWARRNLEQARADAAARRTVEWRYAILRAHEVFAQAAPHFDAGDRRRFRSGLQRVFIDNYAAIPPESIERLLALRAAGRLDMRKLGRDYELALGPDGRAALRVGRQALTFDHLVDARGQSALGVDALPFPSLRLALKANRLAKLGDAAREEASALAAQGGAVDVESSYRLSSGLNPVRDVYFLSLPFLLDRNPFVQGLCSAHDMAEIAAAHLLAKEKVDVLPDVKCEREALIALRDDFAVPRLSVYCLDSGLVVMR
jgi:uncharacterized NAD(P)/FAD-binding protein YdhS